MDADRQRPAAAALPAPRPAHDRGAPGARVSFLYEPSESGGFLPSEHTRGPWDPDAQHGGAPAALIGRALESEDLRLARVTYELVRPVPLAELRLETEVVRPGKRVQLVEARLSAAGETVVRALGLRVRRGRGPGAGEHVLPPSPPSSPRARLGAQTLNFASSANDIRFTRGEYKRPGPALAWVHLTMPVVAGEEPTGIQRALAAADFGNGFSSVLDWDRYAFINPDLTVYFERDPVGSWIALDAVTRLQPDGTGIAESVLFDQTGRFGRAVQALLILPRQ